MSKLVPPISGIACLLWVTVWSWWLSSQHGDPGTQSIPPSISFGIQHNEFQFAAGKPFYFLQSDAVVYMSDDAIALLDSLAVYLFKQEGTVLTLTGIYSSDETNRTEYANLGMARAAAIKEFLVGQNSEIDKNIKTASHQTDNFLLFGGKLMGGVNFSFLEPEEEQPTENTPAQSVENASGKTVDLVINFSNGDYELDKIYLSKLNELRDFLRNNPSKIAVLYGLSQKTEEKVRSGDLAELRAKAVRRYLVDSGVRRKQIKVKSRAESDAHHVEITIE